MRIGAFQGSSAINFQPRGQVSSASFSPARADDGLRWATVVREASALSLAARDLERLVTRTRGGRGGAITAAVSSTVLGMDTDPTASTLRSTERVNTDTRTYHDDSPDWSGGTTNAITISGEWNGTGSETYTVDVERSSGDWTPEQLLDLLGGPAPTKIDIFDSLGNEVDSLEVFESDEGTTVFDIGTTGLQISFGPGDFVTDDTATLAVYEPAPTTVDITNAMNGPGTDGPPFEDGLTVTDGSFFVNGTEVSVSASESIDDVLARITTLTDVTATFDQATQKVVLTHHIPGAEPIDLIGDTSGFLAATKLAGAALESGSDGDDGTTRPMAEVAAFSGVTAGSFLVNGTAISIDPATDSLADVLARINGADADAVASLTGSTVRIGHRERGQDLALDDNGTGFLAAIGLPEGTIEAASGGTGRTPGRVRAGEIADLVAEVGERLENLLAVEAEGGLLRGALVGFGGQVRGALRQAFGLDGDGSTGRAHGLRFDFGTDVDAVFGHGTSDKRALASAIQRDYTSFRDDVLRERTGSEDENVLGAIERLADDLVTRGRGRVDILL